MISANALVYDNYQFLAMGYSSTGRASDALRSDEFDYTRGDAHG